MKLKPLFTLAKLVLITIGIGLANWALLTILTMGV